MYSVSTRFLQTIAESHTPIVVVQLFKTDATVEVLDVTGGSVTVDRGQAVRRTCTVTSPDTSLIPHTAADKAATYGAQLRISRGVKYADSTVELVPLGIFRLDSVTGDPDNGPVTLTGNSLEIAVSDDKFTVPYKATAGSAIANITSLITRSLPGASVSATASDATLGPRTWDVQGDPWAAVQELATGMGAEVYADPDGVFMISVLPDPLTATPVWTIGAGEGGVYVKANRGMSADKVYNAVLASGENTEANAASVSSLVTDADTSSPTYWGGPFGRRPMFYSSAVLTTTAACTAAATYKLRTTVAPNATANLTSLPNAALAPGDVIRVLYPDGSKELHQVQSLTVPLGPGSDFTVATISGKEDA
jgi:hypothetical protein